MTHTLPEPEALQGLIEALHRKYLPLQVGQIANYIPDLARGSDTGRSLGDGSGRNNP
jgi:hypothetical protein